MAKDDPVVIDHVRRLDLPWHVSTLVECGRAVGDVAAVLDRAEFMAKVRRLGWQRAALSTCMTCADTANRYAKSWGEDPVAAMLRECVRPRTAFSDELRALAALVRAHREEFDQYRAGLNQTIDLATARRNRAFRA